MAVALLDVNVLIALFHATHVHHDVAHDWFAENRDSGWASCPLTENGLLRILSNPARVDPYVPLPELVQLLNSFSKHSRHAFWSDEVTLRDPASFNVDAIRGHKQLTDIYLVALAVKNRGRFVTFDRGIPLEAVKAARPEDVVVLAAAD
jgi:hypothetical protein